MFPLHPSDENQTASESLPTDSSSVAGRRSPSRDAPPVYAVHYHTLHALRAEGDTHRPNVVWQITDINTVTFCWHSALQYRAIKQNLIQRNKMQQIGIFRSRKGVI